MKPQTLLLLLALPAGAALAQGSSPIVLTLQQSLVTTVKNGDKVVEKLTPSPKDVLPGAVLSQVVTARNLSDKTFHNVMVRLPVPKGTVYVGPEALNSAVPAEYSIDGGKTFSTQPKRTVTVTENGKTVTREVVASPNEYNVVRWTLSTLGAKAEKKVGFRIKVR